MKIVTVIQGEYAVSRDASVGMTTVLGSCIAACVFDDQIPPGRSFTRTMLHHEPMAKASKNKH